MGDLTKSEAQDLMAKGQFMSHKSDPKTGYKLSRIGNVETHDGGVLSASGFWYNRREKNFDTGWQLFTHDGQPVCS